MSAVDIIAAKRDGNALTEDQIREFVSGILSGEIPDYQASAWLMAIYLCGMTAHETRVLTLAMRDSGSCIDLTDLPNGPTLDKHSTGGVGDKTTLIVVPLLAAAGVPILKMSGRGLGFTGGTVDKLEAIPGLRSDLEIEEAKAQVRRIGAALLAQSSGLAPADRTLYALRDVTATVDSLPLIASSIMSKKLAAGAQRIVLDVKVGRGAFMATIQEADALARALIEIGQGVGVPTLAVLTRMDEPLGRMVGNALEVREAVLCLLGSGDVDRQLRLLCIELAAHGVVATGREADLSAARQRIERLLDSGAGARKFAEIVNAQGGPADCERILQALPVAPVRHEVLAPICGTVAGIDARAVGQLSMRLGAGRAAKSDLIDPAVGIELLVKTGGRIAVGSPIAILHLRDRDSAEASQHAERLLQAFTLVQSDVNVAVPASPILGSIPND